MPDDSCWSQVDLKKYRTTAKSTSSCSAMNIANHRSAAGCLARFAYERKFKVESLTSDEILPWTCGSGGRAMSLTCYRDRSLHRAAKRPGRWPHVRDTPVQLREALTLLSPWPTQATRPSPRTETVARADPAVVRRWTVPRPARSSAGAGPRCGRDRPRPPRRPGRHIVYPENTPLTNALVSILDKVDVHRDSIGDSTGRLDHI